MSHYKPYPAYKDSGVEWLGKVPAGWEVSKLGYLSWVRARLGWKGLKAEEYLSEGYALLATPNIKDYEIDFQNVNFISKDRYDESPEIKIRLGDVLLAKDGSTLGTTNIVRKLPIEATVNSSLAVITPQINLNSSFLYFYLKSQFVDSNIQLLKGGMGVPHLFQSDLNRFIFPLPPIDQQKIIAKKLDSETTRIDTLIAKKTRFIELLKEKRQALITQAVTKGLNPNAKMKDSGVEWLGEVPEHWEVSKLKQNLMEQLTYGANEAAEQDDPENPRFIRITDLTDDGVLKSETFKSLPMEVAKPYLLSEGDVLLARSGATVGKSFLYKETMGLACYAGYLIRARFNTNKILPKFFWYIANSDYYWHFISGSNIQSTIQNVSGEKYGNLWVTQPPSREQNEIVSKLDSEWRRFDSILVRTEQSIALLKERRSALITAAVTGQIDLREAA